MALRCRERAPSTTSISVAHCASVRRAGEGDGRCPSQPIVAAMPNYHRAFVPGGCWFFTVSLLDRRRLGGGRLSASAFEMKRRNALRLLRPTVGPPDHQLKQQPEGVRFAVHVVKDLTKR